MIDEPLIEVYGNLNITKQRFIRQTLWDVYAVQLVSFLSNKQGLRVEDEFNKAECDFVETDHDPYGLFSHLLQLAQQDQIGSVKELCLRQLKQRLDNVQTMAQDVPWSDQLDTEINQGFVDSATTRLTNASEAMLTAFPELRPAIAEFGMRWQREKQVKEFPRSTLIPERKPRH